jgi:glycerol-3-phosphate dehydrogenase
MIGKKEAISLVPNIERDKLNGGIVYYDGQFNDSRMGLDIALTASDNNAVLINYMSFESFIKNKKNNIIGVNTTDILTGIAYKVFGQKIINCTGVFSDSILRKDSFNSKPLIKPSQGIHLVVEKKFLKGDFGILVPKTSDGRILFAVPWLGHVLLGTTETDIDKPVIDPSPKKIEIDFILNTINKYMEIKPKKSDVKSVFVGLRPLISSNKKGKSKDLSRTHKIIISSSGLVSVVGGKWTNYRIMGKEVIDLSLKKMNQKFIKSNTETLKIKNGLSSLI